MVEAKKNPPRVPSQLDLNPQVARPEPIPEGEEKNGLLVINES
jgi:hypothetical protein